MREAVEHLRQDDADRPVDAGAHQPALEEPLVAEDVDQRDGREQRRRKQRQQGDAPGTSPWRGMRVRVSAVGVEEGQRHHDDGRQHRHPDAVPQRGDERRRREVARHSWRGRRSAPRRPGSSSTAASPAAARWRAPGTPPAPGWPTRITTSSVVSRRGAAQLRRGEAHAPALRVGVEHAQQLRRQADGQRLAFRMPRSRMALAEKSERSVRSRAAVGPQRGAAEGAEEIQQLDDDGDGVGRARLDAADAHLLRPQPEPHALPGVRAAERRHRRAPARRPAPGRARRPRRRTCSWRRRNRRRTPVAAGRRYPPALPPARPGRGSSPRCGRPWPAPPPGRG